MAEKVIIIGGTAAGLSAASVTEPASQVLLDQQAVEIEENAGYETESVSITKGEKIK